MSAAGLISLLFGLVVAYCNAYRSVKYSSIRKFGGKRCQTRVFGLADDLVLIANKRTTPTSLPAFIYSQYGLLGLSSLSQTLKSGVGDALLQSAVDGKLSETFKASNKAITVISSTSQFNNYVINNPAELKFNANRRSTIVECLRIQSALSPSSFPTFYKAYYKMKLISDVNRYEREIAAMKRLSAQFNTKEFNQIIFHSPSYVCIGSKGPPLSVIVMAAGEMDLKTFVSKYHPSIISNKAIVKRILLDMSKVVFKIHSKGLVWTDLKVDNFIISSSTSSSSSSTLKQRQLEAYLTNKLLPTDQQLIQQPFAVKAIDLESTVQNGNAATDLSAENLSPEIVSLIAGDNRIVQRGKNDFFLDITKPIFATKAGDIWALGIAFLHVLTGQAPLAESGGNIKAAIQKVERYIESSGDGSILGIDKVENVSLRKLIVEMLQVDPKKRPSVLAVLLKLNLFV